MLKELEIILMKVRISRMERKLPPMASAKLFFYETETTQLKCIFLDQDCDIASPNPVIADGNGDFPDVFFDHDAGGPYRIVLQDRNGEELLQKDYINEA